MSGLGDLVVNLSANTQKFDKNISKSQTGLKSFGTVALSAINPVTAALTAMTAGAVGVGAAVWGLTGRIGDLAGVADRAAQTGLSGAFLQQLEFAADQSGVAAETLTGGIKKLTVMIGKAGDGSKEAAESLKDIGLSAKDLQKLSPEQQFEKVAAGIGKIPTAAGRAAAAVKIFGKSGIEMTTLFAGGLDDITKLMQDARDIGIGLDDEQLKRVADADDSLQKMYASIGAMVDQVAVGLAPAFEKVAENVTGLIGPVTKLFDTFNNMDDRWQWLGDTMVASFDVAIEKVKLNFGQMLKDLKDEAVGAVNFLEDITNPVGMAGQIAGGLMGGNQPAADPNAGLAAAQAKLDGLLGQFQGAADENKKPANVDPVQAAEQLKTDALAKWGATVTAVDEAAKKTEDAFKAWNMTPITDANFEAIKAAYFAAEAITDQARQLRDKAQGEFEAAEASLEGLVEKKKKQKEQQAFNSGVSDWFGKLKDSVSGGLLSDIGNAAGGMLDRAKVQTGAMGGMLEGWFGSFDEKKKQRDLKPQFAGAMQAGSVEAYSTLVQAMMTRGKDPVVQATEKQTKELIKGLKPKREFKNIESFVSL